MNYMRWNMLIWKSYISMITYLLYLRILFSFRQLMCFERSFAAPKDLSTSINDMFRAMQPIFNNQNKSVITPLLATGCQVSVISSNIFFYISKQGGIRLWCCKGLKMILLATFQIYTYDIMRLNPNSKHNLFPFDNVLMNGFVYIRECHMITCWERLSGLLLCGWKWGCLCRR